jgi:hypothetical protein
MKETIRTLDFLDEFVEAVRADLERGEKKWGDTWLNRPREGQVQRIRQYLLDHFDRFEHAGQPVKWESIAGEALIGWIRDNNPDLFP